MEKQTQVKGTFITSSRAVNRRLVRPLRDFMDLEASGGIALLAATIFALAWANSPWQDTYATVWETKATVAIGDWSITEDLRHWVNDALMTIFFFVVGLEIKRELATGELNSVRKATLPAIGALGGMVIPALIFVAFTAGGRGSQGWGIPMATDIAFAIGVLTIVGRSCPSSLKVFLLSLAIVDDIGAILVIALFYSDSIALLPLGVAIGSIGLIIVMRLMNVWWTPIYVVVGTITWLATFESGIHATIAGVALGLLAPATAFQDDLGIGAVSGPDLNARRARAIQMRTAVSVPVTERLAHNLHPWTSYLIIPLFALANAGVVISGESLSDAASSSVAIGIVMGLVVGKLLGITAFCWAAVRLGIAQLPQGAGWRHLAGVSAVAGIGFTVSLFITELAFKDHELIAEAKVAILFASLAATLIGAGLIRSAGKANEEIAPEPDPV